MERIFTSAKFVFGFPIALFLLNLVLVVLSYTLNFHYGSFFMSAPLHFLGGASMAIIFFYFWERNPDIYSFKNKFFINLTLAIGFVALIGALWELHEFLLDSLFSKLAIGLSAQGDLQDTMLDLFFDLAGGFAATMIYFRSSLYKESSLSK